MVLVSAGLSFVLQEGSLDFISGYVNPAVLS